MDKNTLELRITERMEQAISEQVFPGCVVGIVNKSGEQLILPYGKFTYDDDATPVTANTIYDVASITKSIPTSLLALKLIENGTLRLEDLVTKFIPELKNNYSDQITIWHLLTQTLQFSFKLSDFKNETPDRILEILFTSDLMFAPGTSYEYCNATSILLSLVVERSTKNILDVLGGEFLFAPLHMNRTTFGPEYYSETEIAPTECDDWRGRLIQREVHDESTYTLQQKYCVGSAGLFSTVPDLLQVAKLLLNGGVYNESRFFEQATVDLMHQNQLADIGQSTGLGWELNQKWFMGEQGSEQTFGKTGFTGCSFVCDPVRGRAIILLSNRVYPKRKDVSAINLVRKNLADIVLAS